MSEDKKDIIVFFISKVIVGVLGLVTVTLYSSMLDPKAYGEYSLISGLVSALIAILIGWIGSSALRYYIDYQEGDNKKRFISNVLLYLMIMLFLMILIISIFSLLSNVIPINKYLLATIIYTVNLSFVEVFEKVLRSSQKNKVYAISIVMQSVVNIVLFYVLFKYNMEANAVLLSTAFSRLLFVLIALITLDAFRNIKIGVFDKEILKKFLKFGIPMIGVWGISWVLSYCDRYIIAFFYDSYNVGIYDMAYKLAENSINIIITSFTLAVYPILIKIWKNEGKEAVEVKTKGIIKYYFMLLLPGIVGLSLIANKLFLGILDKKYIGGKYVIIIVSIGMAFNGFNSIMNKIWQLKEKTKNIFYIMVISVIINIILNILLVPKYGITMAALTTLFSYLCSNIITYLLIRKEFKLYFDYKSIFKTCISTLIMAIYILWFNTFVTNNIMLLIEILLSCAIYGIMSIVFKNVDIREVRSFKNGK